MPTNLPQARYFVLGTDTGVGKTVISTLLMQSLHRLSRKAFYLKPLQTGCKDPYDTDSDARFVYSHCDHLKNQDPARSVVYCLPNPKAPLFAASDANVEIDPARIDATLLTLSDYQDLVIEAAGGLLVPAWKNATMADLVHRCNARPILVGRAGLGTINHTLLTVEALDRRNLPPLGIVLVESSPTPTSADLLEENRSAIACITGLPVVGPIPFLANFTSGSDACHSILLPLLEQPR
jgi:dethiobiotin synthetase